MYYLSKEELRRLLSVAKAESSVHYLMFATAFRHGLRVSELIGLTTDNLDGPDLTVRRLKGSNQTSQPASAELQAYVAKCVPGTRLFTMHRTTAWRLMQHYGKLAGIAKRKSKPHALKHTTAMQGFAGGMKVNEVQAYLGHKSGASTLRYMVVNDDIASKAFAAAVGNL